MTLTTDILLPHSAVMNQRGTAACWAFSACSFWETERAVAEGKQTVETVWSPWFLARHRIEALCHDMIHGRIRGTKFPVGDMVQTAGVLAQQHGVVPLSVCSGQRLQAETYRSMMRKLRVICLSARYLPFLRGWAARKVGSMLTCHYGAAEAADKPVLEQLHGYASQYDQSFGQEIVLDVPDNYRRFAFTNIPIEELVEMMHQTLLQGHSLIWQGQMSRGFSMKKGVALLPEDSPVSEDMRQQLQQARAITDDHAMHIVGLAHDEQGARYFIAKNSVGDVGKYHGLVFMHEDYIRMKTVAILTR